MKRLLYLPIEVKTRELEGKTLLAARAAERGWQVIIGRDKEVRGALVRQPAGALIELNVPPVTTTQSYQARGHRVSILAEESIVYYGGRDYCRRKLGSPAALNVVNQLLIVGERNAEDVRKYRRESAAKITVTGNPRFDVLMPKLRGVFAFAAEPIRERFGRFLLVNTNFGPVNHVKLTSAQILADMRADGLVEDDAHAAFLQRWHDYKREQLGALKPMLSEINAARRYDTIVIRPHPTESHDSWRAWAEPLGIRVHFEGSANNWMLAAAAMLHTGCTTAVEATLLDLPVTSFVPTAGHEMLNQADEISLQVANATEFLTASALPIPPRLADQRSRAQRLVANTEPPLAVDRILDALDHLDVPKARVRARNDDPFAAAWHRIHSLTRKKDSYAYRKFDGLQLAELIEPIEMWRKAGALGRYPELVRQPDGTWLVF